MSTEQGGPPRYLTTVIWLGTLGVLGVIVLVGLKIGSAFKGGLEEMGERRARDAAVVTAEKEAGRAYMDNLELSMAVLPSAGGDREKLRLEFTITNKGQKAVIRASAEVSIADVDEGKARYVEKVLLFDDSELSVRDDRALVAGERRSVVASLERKSGWNTDDVQHRLSDVRIEVPVEAAAE